MPPKKQRAKKNKAKRQTKALRGRGFFSNIANRVMAAVRNYNNTDPLTRPTYPGEHHAIELIGPYKYSSYNFMGPGTHIVERLQRGDRPINNADAAAMTHDLAYYEIGKLRDPDQIKNAVISADMEALKKWKNGSDWNLPEVKIAFGAISSKLAAQYAGAVPWDKFIDVSA